MTIAERVFADPRRSAFIRGFCISRSVPWNVRFVFSSIGSFSYPAYLSDKGPYDWVALHVACPHL